MNWILPVTIIMGMMVLISYTYVFGFRVRGSYWTHPFWMGIPAAAVKPLTGLQLLAAVGFIVLIISWSKHQPEQGILKRTGLVPVLAVFLGSSAVWPLAVLFKVHWLTVVSLLATASSTVLMLAGSIEEKPRVHRILASLAVAIVTVLVDAVAWNAKYISTVAYNPEYFKLW